MYTAVLNRVAIDTSDLPAGLSLERSLGVLTSLGFRQVKVDMCGIARSLISCAVYTRGARFHEAPWRVDCSSFVKWVYGQCGVWLPRRSIQQIRLGTPIHVKDVLPGDLVFTSGHIDWYEDDPLQGVGHVGVVVSERLVVHAANRQVGVVETPLCSFIEKKKESILRGIRRIVPDFSNLIVLDAPPRWEVETSDDLRWIIYQKM